MSDWLAHLATDRGVTCVARGGDFLFSRQHLPKLHRAFMEASTKHCHSRPLSSPLRPIKGAPSPSLFPHLLSSPPPEPPLSPLVQRRHHSSQSRVQAAARFAGHASPSGLSSYHRELHDDEPSIVASPQCRSTTGHVSARGVVVRVSAK
jgi:hypothetical protein